MTNPNDPAFPKDHQCDGQNGLTKREYFAAMAMAASSGSMAEVHAKLPEGSKADALKILAEFWLMMADNLIAALNRTEEKK